MRKIDSQKRDQSIFIQRQKHREREVAKEIKGGVDGG